MKAQINQDKNEYIVSAEDGTFRTFALVDKDRALELFHAKEQEKKPSAS